MVMSAPSFWDSSACPFCGSRADDGGPAHLGKLHVQLTRHAEADDVLGWEDVDLTLRMQAGGEHRDHRRVRRIDARGQCKHLASRHGDELSEPAVGVAADQNPIGTEMGLAIEAVEILPAPQLRNDNHPRARLQAGRAQINDLARHLLPHDAGILDGDRAVVDLVVGTADAGMGDVNGDVAGVAARAGDVFEDDFV